MITTKIIEDKNIWERFLEAHPEANFLQSWYWGQFHQALGDKIFYTGFFENGALLGVMLSIVEDAKRGRYLTVPAGPIIDWQNQDLVKAFSEEITKIAKENGCIFVRVRPQLKSDEFSQNLFKKLGFKDAPMHLHAELTNQLDITKSEEEILANMRKTTRYEIRKGVTEGVTVDMSQNPSMIDGFYKIQLETARRKDFVPFSYDYLHEQFKIFALVDKAAIFSAYHEKKLLAQAFIVFYGREAAYHYGVSTEAGREYPGAYLIQWEAIKEAKKRGLTTYNFWGVGPADNPAHRFFRISIFKRGFGGVDLQYLHTQDLVINKSKYLLTQVIENTRKKLRGL